LDDSFRENDLPTSDGDGQPLAAGFNCRAAMRIRIGIWVISFYFKR